MTIPPTRAGRISVIMAVYNGALYVEDAARSVLNQTYSELELIVVDDGSTDDTLLVLGRFDDPRLTVISQANTGVAPARNRGLIDASGELVAFIDHDDLWLPHKLATQVARFDDETVGMVGSFMTYLSDQGPTKAVAGESVSGRHELIEAGRLMPFPLSSLVARTSLLRELGGFDVGLAQVAQVEDLDLVARAARIAEVVTVTEPLGFYRVHGGAASFLTFDKMRCGTRFVRDRIVAEREGRTLSWDEWQATVTVRPASLRKDRANFLYRSAGHQMLSGRRLRGLGSLTAATLISPSYVLPRLGRQFGGSIPLLRRRMRPTLRG